ncbi:MAG: T9SS type A sorting domain-containing protein [Bacteroidota bacterium]|nr:T9SS type A sorting domain-containing protein [Bacteroidota bacterium]
MKHIATFLLLLLTTIANGQVLFNYTYPKVNFDYGAAVIERLDGKYLIVGSSRSQFVSDYDVNVLLVDSVGGLIWDKYIGQSPRMEFAYSLIETKDSNFVITGRVNSSNPYLMKFNSTGNLIWEKEYQSYFWAEGFSVGQTYDSGYFFVVPDTSTTLFVTNAIGDTLWTKRYNSVICRSVIQTTDSGFAITGSTVPTTGNQEIVLVKINSSGDTLWTRTFGGEGKDNANSIQQLSDNGYLIAGNYDHQLFDVEKETFIIRTDSVGNTVWTKKRYLGIAHFIKECKNNNGYILSTTNYAMGWIPNTDEYYLVITKLDTLGNIEWIRNFDGYAYSLGNNITQTSDGGYLLTGSIKNDIATANIVLIKLDSIGNYVSSIIDISNPINSQVIAFPNPTTDEINFSIGSSAVGKIMQMKIYNSYGQEIKTVNEISETHFKLDVNSFSKGLYFYKLTTTDKQTLTGKFMVRE